uniref:Helicase n=1 Tax=Panagrolaimus sp. PS1159 TaxID=55785 RepID=A0AC35GUA5_9BILA
MRNVIGALSNGNIVGPGAGAILAHNMGLGKSFTTIAFIHTVLSYFNNVISKVLIIAPQNVTGHWKKEFPKFTITENNRIAEDIRITNFEESGKTLRYNTISNWYKNTREKHIMIMSYDMFKRKAVDFDFHEFLVNPGPDLVIFDEAHKLKNKETQNYKLTVQISTPRKIFLTGTPLQNDPKELYQMINFLHRASVFTINSLNDEFDISISYKLILLIQIIKFCEQVGDKLIVFSQSIDTLDYIENLLQRMSQSWNNRARNCPEGETWKWENGKDYMRIDGTTSGRQEIQEIFEETPQIRLMLMSTVASSLGTNFVSANRVVILDSSWNPVHDIQAIYRTYRINQQKDVFVYRLVTKNTIEEWIYNRQVTKESIARRIVDDEDIENIFSQNELENLY